MTEEEWRTIARAPDYEVSNFGRIRRRTAGHVTFAGRILKSRKQKTGYLLIGLSPVPGQRSFFLVHRLVAEAFLGPPPTRVHETAHWNNQRDDNHASNLRWATRTENFADKARHGTKMLGQRNPASKLTDIDIHQIRREKKESKISNDRLAARYGVSKVAIRCIVNRKTWSHL